MQFEPDRYPTQDYKIRIVSGLGIMAREYEQMQMIQVLQALPPEAQEARMTLLAGIVYNSSLPNREDVVAKLAPPAPPVDPMLADPQLQALQLQQVQITMQLDIAEKQARIRKLNSEATLAEARAVDVSQETELEAIRIAQRGLYAVENDKERDRLFNERYKMAQLALKEKDIETRREISQTQLEAAKANQPQPVVQPFEPLL